MKVYLLTDLEGVAGVATFEDCTPTGRFYPQARQLLTQEVNAAVEGLLAAGATQVVVLDGHGYGGVNPHELHPEARLLHGRGLPPRLGLDESFDAFAFVGQHCRNNVPGGHLAHTFSSQHIDQVLVNGEPVGELGFYTYMAGALGVPVVLVTGDDAVCREARQLIPGVEAVEVKRGLGRECALSLAPAKARSLIREGATAALRRRASIPPVVPRGPFQLEVHYLSADLAARKAAAGWRRLDLCRVAVEAEDYLHLVDAYLGHRPVVAGRAA